MHGAVAWGSRTWKSILLSACFPPLMMLAIGTGSWKLSLLPWRLAMCFQRGMPWARAAARQQAMDTPRIPLAPT